MESVGDGSQGVSGWLPRWLGGPPPSVTAVPLTPDWIQGYAQKCRDCGVDRLYVILTFDCDTDIDIEVVGGLDADLRRRGILAGYAVPGAQLRKSPDTWRAVAERGAEFLNHGGRAHAEWRDGRYWPITDYKVLAPHEVVADIQLGDRLLRETTGATPEGFRAPHFGSFQRDDQLAIIYDAVRPLGYTYCSTTIPATAHAKGPLVDVGGGLAELPTFGSYRYPLTLLDTWTYLTDRSHYALGEEYFDLFEETVRKMTDDGVPGLLTYYGDPSHVVGQRPFERALDTIDQFKVPTLLGRDAVKRFRPRVG
jgi:peptidoglycan/xylan/chitin deacetylase (PgdA/CDA1 family)